MLSSLRPINLLPARERVASSIRKAIISNELKKGEEISIEKMAERLGVSATPIREAYQILAQDGLIKLRPNKGAIVIGMTEKWVREHYEVRAALESEAARLAVLSGNDISTLENIISQSISLINNGEYSRYSDMNQAFHFAIWELSGNDKLKDMLSNLWNGLSVGQNITIEEYASISLREHIDILGMVSIHDADGAYNLMHKHIYRSLESMLAHQ